MEVASLTTPTGLAAIPVHLSDSVLMSRGFETVSYMLEGEFTHEDFLGNKGTLKPGDLQWMTAGTVWDSLQCALSSVQWLICCVLSSVCKVKWVVCNVKCTLLYYEVYIVHCEVYIVHCEMYIVQSEVYTIHLYSV